MSSKYLIHGRIAAKSNTGLPTAILNARHALVRRDMQSETLYWSHVAVIGAAIVVGIVAAFVI